MVVSITGKPGSGKTTLLIRLLSRLKGGEGFYTEEVRKNGERVGFTAKTSWGEEVVLARKDLRSRWRVGRYGVDIERFESRVVKPLRERVKNSEVVYIDEVGKMECLSKRFVELVEELLEERDKLVIFTIPFKDFNGTIAKVRENSDLVIDVLEWRNRWEELGRDILRRWKGW